MIDIRGVEDFELLDLYEIETTSFQNNYRISTMIDMYKNKNYKFTGIYMRDKIVGYIIILDSVDIYEVIKVAIAPNYRGKSLGKKLLTNILKTLEKDMMLEVRESNEGAIKFYEGLGLRKVGVRKGYYGDTKEDAFVYLYSV